MLTSRRWIVPASHDGINGIGNIIRYVGGFGNKSPCEGKKPLFHFRIVHHISQRHMRSDLLAVDEPLNST